MPKRDLLNDNASSAWQVNVLLLSPFKSTVSFGLIVPRGGAERIQNIDFPSLLVTTPNNESGHHHDLCALVRFCDDRRVTARKASKKCFGSREILSHKLGVVNYGACRKDGVRFHLAEGAQMDNTTTLLYCSNNMPNL